MSDSQPILVIGGTRGTGLLITRLLLRRGQRVRVLAGKHADCSIPSRFCWTLSLYDCRWSHDKEPRDHLFESVEGQHSLMATSCREGDSRQRRGLHHYSVRGAPELCGWRAHYRGDAATIAIGVALPHRSC